MTTTYDFLLDYTEIVKLGNRSPYFSFLWPVTRTFQDDKRGAKNVPFSTALLLIHYQINPYIFALMWTCFCQNCTFFSRQIINCSSSCFCLIVFNFIICLFINFFHKNKKNTLTHVYFRCQGYNILLLKTKLLLFLLH